MSVYLRFVIGPVVVCDIELFGSTTQHNDDEPPAQLAGGAGTVIYPEDADTVAFGFTRPAGPR